MKKIDAHTFWFVYVDEACISYDLNPLVISPIYVVCISIWYYMIWYIQFNCCCSDKKPLYRCGWIDYMDFCHIRSYIEICWIYQVCSCFEAIRSFLPSLGRFFLRGWSPDVLPIVEIWNVPFRSSMIVVGPIELLGERRDLASMEAMDADHGLMMIDAFFHMKRCLWKNTTFGMWLLIVHCN